MPVNSLNVDLLAGEKLTLVGPGKVEFQAVNTAKAAKGTTVLKGANGVAMTQGATTGGNMAGGKATTLVAANAQGGGGMTSVASKTGTAAIGKVPAVAGGTIWTGKGLSLGLGLGLGAWGPVILTVAVATGGYLYYKKRQSRKLWPLWSF